MPRVTRRSIAAKDESPAPEPPKSGRGKRGAKKEEAEDTPIGEPQELPPKRGRQAAAEAQTPGRGRSAAKGRSSSKANKEEPEPEEEEDIEEEKTPQKGRAASRGRGKSARGRGGRSTSRATKAQAVDLEDEEEDIEEEKVVSEEQESTPNRGRGRGKKGKSSSTVKDTTLEIGQGEGKASDAEEEENEEEIAEEQTEVKAKPGRGKGKQSVQQSPKGGRRGRGKSAPAEEESEEKEEIMEQIEASPSGRRSGRGQRSRDSTPKQSTPPSGSRRGRSSAAAEESEAASEIVTGETAASATVKEQETKSEVITGETEKSEEPQASSEDVVGDMESSATVKEPEAAAKKESSTPSKVTAGEKEPSDAPDSPVVDKSEKANIEEQHGNRAEEVMETESAQELKHSSSNDKQIVPDQKEALKNEAPKDVSTADNVIKETETSDQEMKTEIPLAQESKSEEKETGPAKKRKLDEDDDGEKEADSTAKRQRTSESTADVAEEDAGDDLQDFVMVNKDEVPPPDSKEVAQSISKAMPVKDDQEQAMPAPPVDVSNIVPLTEAELAKRYTNIHREKEREENSSTIVEIGSEPASDVTSISARLDVSDAVSMDSSVMDQPQESSSSDGYTAESQKETPSEDKNNTPLTEITAPPPVPMETESSASCEAVESSEVQSEAKPSNESNPVNSLTAPPSVQENSLPSSTPVKAESQNISSNSSSAEQSLPSSQENSKKDISSSHVEPVVKDNQQQKPVSSIPVPPSVPSAQTPSTGPTTASEQQPTPANQLNSPTGKHNGIQKSEIKSLPSLPVKTPGPINPEKYVPSSPAIDKRKFIPNPNFPVELMDPAFCFSVVTYNILADCHLRRWDYSFTEPQYLDQTYRHNLMMKELAYLDGDIVCMQEVSPMYYEKILLPAMASRGYAGSFLKRTKEYYDEGEASFIKTSKFDVIYSEGVSLKDLSFKEVESASLSEEVARAARKHLDRADVILLSKLTCKKTGKTVTICNIHVVYDPKAPDVQCIQVASAIKELVSKAGSDLNPHIICGDFNSEVSSPGYQLAKDGYLSDVHIHKLQALESMDNTDGTSQSVVNHMWKAFQHTSSSLRSAYETAAGKEPTVTSYNKLTYSTLDYIFHSSSTLDTVGVLEALDKHVVDTTGGLPSTAVPSDHLSLKAIFRIKD